VRLLYLTHDLTDSAVAKRTLMLTDGGADVRLCGFRRSAQPVSAVGGQPCVDWGQTFNGGFIRRILQVLKTILSLPGQRHLFADCDLILARNLEMLAIAVRARSLCPSRPPVVYECLDVHRLMLGNTIISRLLLGLEGRLGKRVSAVLTSSPAYIEHYFGKRSPTRLKPRLLENKVYPGPGPGSDHEAFTRPVAPPWKIGWYGILRCHRSLAMLTELAQRASGRVEVIIRGRPALDQFDDFHGRVARSPHVTFLGPYQNPADLEAMYRDVHFSWAIDMFEEGLNSAWLLPNRLYEGGLYGSIPMAQAHVETGRRVQSLGIGPALEELNADRLLDFFNNLTESQYRTYAQNLKRLPQNQWFFTKQDCKELVEYLNSLRK